jgi:ribonuclease HI
VLALETVRQEWDDGNRRFEEAARDPAQRDRLLEQLDTVLDELRKRVGQTFTLDDLALAYATADRWAREAVEERAASPGWARHVTVVQAAAFHVYQRGAVDYMQ